MDLVMFGFYIFALLIISTSIVIFLIILKKHKNNIFRFFPFVQFSLFIYLIADFILFFHGTNRPDLFMHDVNWMSRILSGIYGIFMIFRFLFFQSLLKTPNSLIINGVFLATLTAYFSMLFLPVYWNDSMHSPGWGYIFNIVINFSHILYFLISILLYAKNVKNDLKKKILNIWKILIFLYIPFIIFQTYFQVVFLLQDIYEDSMKTISVFYIGGGLGLIIFVNVFYLLFIRNNTSVKTEMINSKSVPQTIQSKWDSFYEREISQRELEIVTLIAEGKSNKEICDTLFISLPTVKTHIYNIYRKLSVRNRVELINRMKRKDVADIGKMKVSE